MDRRVTPRRRVTSPTRVPHLHVKTGPKCHLRSLTVPRGSCNCVLAAGHLTGLISSRPYPCMLMRTSSIISNVFRECHPWPAKNFLDEIDLMKAVGFIQEHREFDWLFVPSPRQISSWWSLLHRVTCFLIWECEGKKVSFSIPRFCRSQVIVRCSSLRRRECGGGGGGGGREKRGARV